MINKFKLTFSSIIFLISFCFNIPCFAMDLSVSTLAPATKLKMDSYERSDETLLNNIRHNKLNSINIQEDILSNLAVWNDAAEKIQ